MPKAIPVPPAVAAQTSMYMPAQPEPAPRNRLLDWADRLDQLARKLNKARVDGISRDEMVALARVCEVEARTLQVELLLAGRVLSPRTVTVDGVDGYGDNVPGGWVQP